METTVNWLKRYVAVDSDVDTIEQLLTMSGSEVEERETVDAANDTALKLEITSNRTDCYGVLGLARELSALTGAAFSYPDLAYKTGKTKTTDVTSVEIECPDLCPYYTAQVIKGVTIGPSPDWLRELIETLGAVKNIRPVNNVVDITNFVLLEMAQPLHAFDYNALAENRIVVRRAKRGETMRAINDIEYTFDSVPGEKKRQAGVNYDHWYWSDDICVIADAERPQCLGGVMGGLDSEISEKTTDILLESAYFAPMNNRATSRGLGLHSDSSYRFSRGVDPAGVLAAQKRCAQLIVEICGGEVCDGIIEAGSIDIPSYTVDLRLASVERVLGIEVPKDKVVKILEGLGLEVKADKKGDVLAVTSPSSRRDLVREIDLIEEIARIHGLDQIPVTTQMKVHSQPASTFERVTDLLADLLVGSGYHQTVTDSFVQQGDLWLQSPWAGGGPMVVTNPVVKGQGLLRPGLAQSLLLVRKSNQDRGMLGGVQLFEQARVYAQHPKKTKNPKLPAAEKNVLAISTDGAEAFFELKGIIEMIGEHAQLDLTFAPSSYALFEEGHGAEVRVGDRTLGVFGDVAKKTLDAFELQSPCAVAELDVDLLAELIRFERKMADLPRFPGMERELALVLPAGALWQDIEATIRAHGTDLLTAVEYLDEYRGKQIPKGKKQYTLRMAFQAPDRSLTADEINALTDQLVAKLGKEHHAELRA